MQHMTFAYVGKAVLVSVLDNNALTRSIPGS